nr:hypothetical protein CFP56_41277 [Quercus suber]
MIDRGACVRSVQVCGRLRSLVKQNSPSLCEITFCGLTGHLEVHERLQIMVEGQLDHHCENAACLDITTNDMKSQIVCLEVGMQTMLLMLPTNQEENTYRRIGIASSLRGDFFRTIDYVDSVILI